VTGMQIMVAAMLMLISATLMRMSHVASVAGGGLDPGQSEPGC
jgi:hypothetical protein